MTDHLRLRQLCLAAPRLAPVIDDLCAIFRVEVCHRDQNVGRFGLANALLPIGSDFLEVVAPTRPDTAVGRFVSRNRGHGGYMVIFQASDPRRRQAHAAGLGVRTVLAVNRDLYQNTQLHPKDCGAAILEFGCSTGGEERMAAWWPAGEHWQDHVRTLDTQRMAAVEIESPSPQALAERWSRIIEVPLEQLGNTPCLRFDDMAIHFVAGETECLSAIHMQVVDVAATLERAVAHGYRLEGNAFHIAGVYLRVVS